MSYLAMRPFGVDKFADKLTDSIGKTTSSIVEKVNVENIVGTAKQTSSAIVSNLRERLPAIIIGSLSLIAGLVWNDAFNAIINKYVPSEYRSADNAKVKFIYALCLTIAVIIIISIIV